MEREQQQALDCMVQNVSTFLKQFNREEEANFGEPCEECGYNKECNFDWLSRMRPLLRQSNVKISMALVENQDKPDSDHHHPVLDRGIRQTKDNGIR